MTIGSQTLVPNHVVNPVGAYNTYTNSYTSVQSCFTVPASGSYVLSFNMSGSASGTALLLDNVSIAQVTPSTNFVLNGSFEVDTCQPPYGYGSITDWPCTIGTSGLNTETINNFANNGAIPDGVNVAFMQTGGLGGSASLYQTINGLQQNVYYLLRYYENSASSYPGIPSLNVTIGSQTLVANHVVNPVGAYNTYTNPYTFVQTYFTVPADGSYVLSFNMSGSTSGSALLLDDVSITQPTLLSVPYSDEVTIDGDLSDWSDATWNSFDTVFNKNTSGIPLTVVPGGGSQWAVKWGAGGTQVYVAAMVNDLDHYFTDTFVDWNTADSLEIYLHTTGTSSSGTGTGADYLQYQEPAQEWSIGIETDQTDLWATNGYPVSYGAYTPASNEFVAVGKVVGSWLYYEAAMTPYQFFASRWNLYGGGAQEASVISPLSAGELIGNEVCTVSAEPDSDGDGFSTYVGMLCTGPAGPWASDYTTFLPPRLLVRVGVQGTITLTGYTGVMLGSTATVVITDANNYSEIHNVVLDSAGTYTFKTSSERRLHRHGFSSWLCVADSARHRHRRSGQRQLHPHSAGDTSRRDDCWSEA